MQQKGEYASTHPADLIPEMLDALKACGVKGDDLAEAIGVNRSTVHRWRHGVHQPPWTVMDSLIDAVEAMLEDMEAGRRPLPKRRRRRAKRDPATASQRISAA